MRCYLLAVSSGSVIDVDSNNITLFNLVEQAQVDRDEPGAASELEVHAYWEFDLGERGLEHEVRFKVTNGAAAQISSAHKLMSMTPRLRMRSRGLGIPGVGSCTVEVEWRVTGREEWHDGGQRWPLQIELQAPPRGAS